MRAVYHNFSILDSTNEEAKRNPNIFFEKNYLHVISSKIQTQGRGRFGKKWLSISDNIYSSFCFLLKISHFDLSDFVQIGALCIKEVLETKISSHIEIKWPNDVLVNNKKIAGILCETISIKQNKGLIIGIGFNINQDQNTCNILDQNATSLFLESQTIFNTQEILFELTELLLKKFVFFT